MRWLARYEEGYISKGGEVVTVSNTVHREHGWGSPDSALETWESRGDFDDTGTRRLTHGKEQFDDVSDRPEFQELAIAKLWRRITFERSEH